MASRKEQKEQARQERLAREQELAANAAQRKRLQLIGGVAAAAVVIVAVIVVISIKGGTTKATASPTSSANVAAAGHVNTLLAGIEQHGSTLGNPSAKVTITEYGDLECSVCDEFALATGTSSPAGVPGSGIENELIDNDVKTGKAKLVYKSMQTATPSSSTFALQQSAAYAAGLQNKAWNYVELFYNEQGQEDTGYVNMAYLEGIAKQIPGLNYTQWLNNVNSAKLRAQVASENTSGVQLDDGSASTPTILIQGPKNEALFQGLTAYSKLASAIDASA